jgi:formiminotetrahydrofolate cyclodeaminase
MVMIEAAGFPSSAPAGDRNVGSQSIDGFLDALASGAPSPGGGSAAALTGALAAALIAMVCRVTAERDPAAGDLTGIAGSADGLRNRLKGLAGADADAYEALLAARRLPAHVRAAAAQAALRRATEVPLDVAAASREALALAERVARVARASTLADLRVAAALGRAALDGAAVTARINLRDSTDRDFAGVAERQVDALIDEGRGLAERVARTVADRIGRVE